MQKKHRSGRASTKTSIEDEIAHLRGLDLKGLRSRWQSVFQRDFSAAATLFSAATQVRGRFWVNQCGPSRHPARNAPAALRIFARHPKKTFATISARNGHGGMSDLSP